MTDVFFSVQYPSKLAPIKESKTQLSGSTGIYLSRDHLSASCESPMTNTGVFQSKETPDYLESREKQRPQPGQLTLVWSILQGQPLASFLTSGEGVQL